MTDTPPVDSTERTETQRWNKAIDYLVNCGTVSPYMDTFWAYVDGEITHAEFKERMCA